MTSTRRLGWTALALFALAGCDSTPAPLPPGPPAPAAGAPGGAPPVARPDDRGASAAPAKLSDEEIAEVKKLSPEDQAIAMAQITCPVSNEHLGEMGAPIKQTIDGKTFFICCASCEKDLKADPAKYLAKLKK